MNIYWTKIELFTNQSTFLSVLFVIFTEVILLPTIFEVNWSAISGKANPGFLQRSES